MKIKEISIHNYRQLKDVKILLNDNITVLAGPNNSGKTSFITLLKNILSSDKFNYTYNDVPIESLSVWSNKFLPDFKEKFCEEDLNKGLINTLSCLDENELDLLTVKMEVTYDTEKDDISNFAEYLMDFDETKNSIYFLYTYKLNKEKFRDNISKRYSKIKRIIEDEKDENKAYLEKVILEIYFECINEVCFYTDSEFTKTSPLELKKFRKLFNFNVINAVRKLDDVDNDSSQLLSKSIISLAKKEKDWVEKIEGLPSSVLATIQNTEIQKTVKDVSETTLNNVLDEFTTMSGGNTAKVGIDMDLSENDISNLLDKATCAKYNIGDYSLNEASQGLGYSNMIYLHMQIEEFKKSVDKTLINLLFIEEPESHMHPQMQGAFLKHLTETYEGSGIQGLITTHSNEMVRVAGLENLRIIRNKGHIVKLLNAENNQELDLEKFTSCIYDLAEFKEVNIKQANDEELENFFDWFFEIGFSEIIFADKVILYEGDTERLYIKKLLTHKEVKVFKALNSQYIAYVQVGGAYAYKYKALIEFLCIKTLIITDIDYNKKTDNSVDIMKAESTNYTINNFYHNIVKSESTDDKAPKEDPTVEQLYKLIEDDNNIYNNLIYVAYQNYEIINGSKKYYYARTLEEAMLSKIYGITSFEKKPRSEWVNLRKDKNLKFVIPRNLEGEKDSEFSMRDILGSTSKSKTDFMYSVILAKLEMDMLPNYIKEGLEWLQK